MKKQLRLSGLLVFLVISAVAIAWVQNEWPSTPLGNMGVKLNGYINWGGSEPVFGASGYGIRSYGTKIQFKDNNDEWISFRNSPYVANARTFGAKGDGVTDDTAAIQNAVLYATSHMTGYPSGGVYIPGGTYKITQPIMIYSFVQIFGDGGLITRIVPYKADPYASGFPAFKAHLSHNYYWSVRNLFIDFSEWAFSGTAAGLSGNVPAAPGSGYSVGDVLTLAGGSGAEATVLAVNAAGGVLAVQPKVLGVGYTTGTKATTVVPAGGTGCTLTIDSIRAGASDPGCWGFYLESVATTMDTQVYMYEISDVYVFLGYGAFYDSGTFSGFATASWAGKLQRVWSKWCRYGFVKHNGTTMLFENCYAEGQRNPLIDRGAYQFKTGYSYTLTGCAMDKFWNGGANTLADSYGAAFMAESVRGLTINSFLSEGNWVSNTSGFGSVMAFYRCPSLTINGYYTISTKYVASDVVTNSLIKFHDCSGTVNAVTVGAGGSALINQRPADQADIVIGAASAGAHMTMFSLDSADTQFNHVVFNGCTVTVPADLTGDANPFLGTRYAVKSLGAATANNVFIGSWLGTVAASDPATYVSDVRNNVCWLTGTAGVTLPPAP